MESRYRVLRPGLRGVYGEVWEFIPDIWVRRGLGSSQNVMGVGYEGRD